MKPAKTVFKKVFVISLIISLALFIFQLYNHTTPYYKDIDPFVEACYSPISYWHSIPFVLMHILSVFSIIMLRDGIEKLPPLQICCCIFFVTVGILINCQFLYHISYHDTSRIYLWRDGDGASIYLSFYPILLTLASVSVLRKTVINKANINQDYEYEEEWLNSLNKQLLKVHNLTLFSMILFIPFLILVVIILFLFGQDVDAMNRVYSETATWRLSQHIHPPTVDDRHGHYLCTVAALGTPSIVKPIGLGFRNGEPIIINRQLQIANAFENVIEKSMPKVHIIIRKIYDEYGFNLSKRINSAKLSNITYLLMKPLEWFFLAFIYFFEIQPEQLIKQQYRMHNG